MRAAYFLRTRSVTVESIRHQVRLFLEWQLRSSARLCSGLSKLRGKQAHRIVCKVPRFGFEVWPQGLMFLGSRNFQKICTRSSSASACWLLDCWEFSLCRAAQRVSRCSHVTYRHLIWEPTTDPPTQFIILTRARTNGA